MSEKNATGVENQGQEISALDYNELPRDKRGEGLNPDAAKSVEAEGQWPIMVVHCWNCSAPNRISAQWSGFICWNDGVYNSKW